MPFVGGGPGGYVAALTAARRGAHIEQHVKVVCSIARFSGTNILMVDDNHGQRQITAKHLILAPGSIAAYPPIEGLDLPGVMTSTEALDVMSVPSQLIVIGGGVMGLELACIYEALGSRVTVIEMASTVLPAATDEILAKRLQVILKRRGMVIHTSTTIDRIERIAVHLVVHAKGPSGEAVTDGERVLVAIGRWPNTQGMGFGGPRYRARIQGCNHLHAFTLRRNHVRVS